MPGHLLKTGCSVSLILILLIILLGLIPIKGKLETVFTLLLSMILMHMISFTFWTYLVWGDVPDVLQPRTPSLSDFQCRDHCMKPYASLLGGVLVWSLFPRIAFCLHCDLCLCMYRLGIGTSYWLCRGLLLLINCCHGVYL